MPPIVIVLIATAPLIYWLLKRGTKPRVDKQDDGPASHNFSSGELDHPANEVISRPSVFLPNHAEEVQLTNGCSDDENDRALLATTAPFQSHEPMVDVDGMECETPHPDEADRFEASVTFSEDIKEALPLNGSESSPLVLFSGRFIESDNTSSNSTAPMKYAQVFAGSSQGSDSSSIAIPAVDLPEDDLTIECEGAHFTPTAYNDELSGSSVDTVEAKYQKVSANGDQAASRVSSPHFWPTQVPDGQESDIDGPQEMRAPVPQVQEIEVFDTVPGDDFSVLIDEAELAENEELEQITDGDDSPQAPSRYRPPTQRPPRKVAARISDQEPKIVAASEAALEIRIRASFDRFGVISMIGLLPVRPAGLDSELEVKVGNDTMRLVAQEEWYQDLQFENIGQVLRQGIELRGRSADARRIRWQLKGRDVYVLASHPRASGVVSTNRLTLGRSHVVFCLVESIQQIEDILIEAGCNGYAKIDQTHEVPSGWAGFRDVTPTKAIQVLGFDPFYAIKPAPDMEIELEGGICLRNSVWLAGYPPRIKLFGPSNDTVKVLIDGEQAEWTAEGSLTTDGYDLNGEHSVYCEGLSCSRSYSIEDPPDSWEKWSAYRTGKADVCGPLVEPDVSASGRRPITVPMSNPLLIGAEPGQVFWCSSRRVSRWKGLVPFDVVWALPAHPHICDKKSARIIQFGNVPVATWKPQKSIPRAWCDAILDASRKGLRIDNESPDSIASWREYKKLARNIRRRER